MRILLILFANLCFANEFEGMRFITEELPPLSFLSTDKKPSGTAVEALSETLKILNAKNTHIQFLPWARGYALTQIPGKNNVLFATARTKERETLFKWAGPISSYQLHLIGIIDRSNRKIDLSQYTYSSLRSDISETTLTSKGILSDSINSYEHIEDALLSLYQKESHFLAYNKEAAKRAAKKYHLDDTKLQHTYKLKKVDLYFAFNRSIDDDVVEKFDKALKKALSKSTREIRE